MAGAEGHAAVLGDNFKLRIGNFKISAPSPRLGSWHAKQILPRVLILITQQILFYHLSESLS